MPVSKILKRPQTKFHTDTMGDSKAVKSKKIKIYRQVKISLQQNFFSLAIFY